MPQTQFEQIESVLAELEQAEQRLDQLQMELARSHRLATLGTLAAIVAHEFNNLLTPVISYCQIALKQDLAEDPDLVRKALTRAHEGAAKAAQIATGMLGFARNQDADQASHVATVINDVFTCLARDPAKDGITLNLDIDEQLFVAISPLALQQVILNLVLNARNAMRAKRGRLAITARPIDQKRAQLLVADSGPGIPKEIIDDLFKPFVTRRARHDDPTSPGTGLGLTICHDLVTRAGGTIEVESHTGKGATFIIILPRAAATADQP